MDFPRGDSEALYRGHISGRRLRGVKINPIYQENDVGRSRAIDDTQSDNSILVGEIQIDLYESLPRQRKIRQYNSDPMLLNSTIDAGSAERTCECGGRRLRLKEENRSDGQIFRESSSSTGFSPSSKDRGGHGNAEALSSSKTVTDADSDDVADDEVLESQSNACSAPVKRPGHHSGGFLVRQARVDGVSDSSADSKHQLSEELHDGCVRDGPDLSTSHPCSCHDADAVDNEPSCTHDVTNDKFVSEREPSLSSFQDIYHILDEMVAEIEAQDFANEDCNNDLEKSVKFSPAFSNGDVKCMTFKTLDREKCHTTDELSNEPTRVGYVLQRSPAYYCLDTIVNLPTYSDMHYIGTISPTDCINNNNVTIPDQMLIMPKTPSNGKINKARISESDAFTIVHSTSKGSSIDVEVSSLTDVQNKDDKAQMLSECSCKGKPSLKCACGRLALQKLLKQKNLIVGGDDGNEVRIYSTISDSSSTPDCVRKNSITNIPNTVEQSDVIEHISEEKIVENCNDSEITQLSPNRPNPISKNNSGNMSKQKGFKPEDRVVTFANDTVFNEALHEYYDGELQHSGWPCERHGSICNGGCQGLDNPVFVCDDEGNLQEVDIGKLQGLHKSLPEEFGRRGTKKHPRAKKRVSRADPVLLSADNLNTPAYLDSYLHSITGNDVIALPTKAKPVSIEAIGGTAFAGFDNITEASDDEFEYYRRRRKHKYDDYDAEAWLRKMDRPKKIKICVVVVLVIALIITGVALSIHFGTPSVNGTRTEDHDLVRSRSATGTYVAPF